MSATNARPVFVARLARFDAALTRFEAVQALFVIALEIAAFSFWIGLKGLSTRNEAGELAGIVFRAPLGAVVVGIAAHAALRRHAPQVRAIGAVVGALLGVALAVVTKNVGVAYFSNWINWLQDASSLTLLGGLRGVGTELTWWLAMLGGSLATGGGKHIHVDVLLRFLRPRLRLPAAALGWLTAAVVCLTAVWGFFDHISIESFGAPAQASASEKIAIVAREGRQHAFLLRKQMGLDVMTSLHVLVGQNYDEWLYGTEWNEWVRRGGWDRHFPPDQLERILLPDEALGQLHPPLVVMPSGGNDRGLIARDLHLIFPFGLLIIGIRFLVRAILALFMVAPPADEYGAGHDLTPEADHDAVVAAENAAVRSDAGPA
jgi:TRAP-type C4-dicarboxylate transport system permease small subunit